MTQTTVNPSLIVRNKPKKHYREEDFCLVIVGWCPCSDCASFSFESIPCLQEQDSLNTSMETRFRSGNDQETLKEKLNRVVVSDRAGAVAILLRIISAFAAM